MRKTKQELNKYRGERAIELYRFLAELKENEKDMLDIKGYLKDYRKENHRLRAEIMLIFKEFKNVLTLREYYILCKRFRINSRHGKRYTLIKIGKIFKVSRERIRQIESRGLDRIRGLIGF